MRRTRIHYIKYGDRLNIKQIMPRPYIKLKLWPTISNHVRKPDSLSTSQIGKVRLSLAKSNNNKPGNQAITPVTIIIGFKNG